MLPIISYNGTCRFPVRERAFLLKGLAFPPRKLTPPRKHTEITTECDEDNNCSLHEKN